MGVSTTGNNAQLGLTLALQRFAEEGSRTEAIDTKATLVLGFAGVVAGLLFNGLSGLVTGSAFEPLKPAISILLGTGFAAVLLAALLALAALWIREFAGGPGGGILVAAVKNYASDDLQLELTEQYASAAEHNWTQNQKKVRFLQMSFFSITLGTLIIFVSVFFILFQQGVFNERL